ncbi:MAG TPA: ATP-grasp domain-containing protein [Dehalococcoidia bacterium]|nr:ATP-grasp domain-containing protein [Dehalococcoidia bacterium]
MPRVLLLIPSATYRAPDFMEAAGKLDVQVVVGSDQRQALEEIMPGRALAVDMAHPEHGAEQIADFAHRYPLDTILPVDDGGTLVAALASEWLGLPHNPVAAVQATRDKHLLRERLAASGVLSPPYRLVDIDADPQQIAGDLFYPCVLKPLALSGSRGVMRADNAAQFVAAFARLKALLAQPDVAAECGPAARQALVEGYIPGEEVALEGLLTDGRLHVLALFDKPDPLVGPFFEETIYVTPSRLPAETQAQIAATAERAARALGLRDGPLHAELRLNELGAWPVDIAARSIGGLCSRTLSFGTGMSLEELILRHATGAAIPSFEREGSASGVMMIPIPAPGVLREVAGIEKAEAVPGIVSVTISIHRGQEVVPLPEGSEYLGFIFAKGEEPAQVEGALRRAHAALRFTIEPAGAKERSGGRT